MASSVLSRRSGWTSATRYLRRPVRRRPSPPALARALAARSALQTLRMSSAARQFALRLGSLAPLEKGTHSPSDEQLSPVFLQFVECVWHLCQQMPRAFEFNTSYLAALLHHALACETGTFLCNCERQRVALELPALTASAWDMLGGEEFRNFEYEPSGDVLLPDVSASTLRPWSAYYCRGGTPPSR